METIVSHILLFDSDNNTRTALNEVIRGEIPAPVLTADTCPHALEQIRNHSVTLAFCQLGDQNDDALELIQQINTLNPHIVTILLVPEETTIGTKRILQSGAHFFLHAPTTPQEIIQLTHRALQHALLLQPAVESEPKQDDGFSDIIGQSSSMQHLFTMITRLADDGESTILIQGESGTGKELVAKAVHLNSPRRNANFVPLNCAAIPDELLESELFGYEKGAFTGAINNKKGRLQHAEGGTLFLDEIGDMKPSLQAKLLRVIQEKEFEPVGSVKSIKVNVRIVAATHRNLEEAVAKGSFREDLYYRLNVIPLQIPPLRDRKDDIALLLEHFTQKFCTSKKRHIFTYSDQALNCLKRYPWPGNVRELENLVQRLSILHMGETVAPKDLPEKYLHEEVAPSLLTRFNEQGTTDFNSRVSEFEDRLILQALMQTGGNKKEAAELLNLKRTTLLEKIKKKQLDKALNKLENQSGL
ncbi:sigma-54-dependent Fis family transcriptional regulator [Desulfuromonas acetoxidans]|nr:sigma-54-dependent Fis family transcriptional regulator [Desulfuromonas acetoxidans]NVD25667.1 sigma-54-dependent Fis family transcriptional regulator [Desulfuromonas acetoxidans]NVE17720.1 sigma-54-dependent Fis family transcriptional regulator [Desulfuromonas acetoxidans]